MASSAFMSLRLCTSRCRIAGVRFSSLPLKKDVFHRVSGGRRSYVATSRPSLLSGNTSIDASNETIDKRSLDGLSVCLRNMRDLNPLVFCLTNCVTPQRVADTLLAVSASPAMIEHHEELDEFADICSSIYLNTGLHPAQIASINALKKYRLAVDYKRPHIIVDPVAVGATKFRSNIILDALRGVKPDVIKGNTAEITYLSEGSFGGKGVDSCSEVDLTDVVACAKKVAREYNCVVAVTGSTDCVVSADGLKTAIISYDAKPLTKITGTGCAVGSVIAATVPSLPDDIFSATVAGLALFKHAAREALKDTKSPGSLSVNLLDQLTKVMTSPDRLAKHFGSLIEFKA